MIHENVFIGKGAYVGKNCKIQQFAYIPDGVVIGNDVFVGPGATFLNDKHPPSNGMWRLEPPTVVGNHASIGGNSTILPGIMIGEHAVIGAGSVVTKNVPPHTTVYGNPAK